MYHVEICFFCFALTIFWTGSAASGRARDGRESEAAAVGAGGESVPGPRHSTDGCGRTGRDFFQPHAGTVSIPYALNRVASARDEVHVFPQSISTTRFKHFAQSEYSSTAYSTQEFVFHYS